MYFDIGTRSRCLRTRIFTNNVNHVLCLCVSVEPQCTKLRLRATAPVGHTTNRG